MKKNGNASTDIEKRRRLSPKEYEELKRQLESGDTEPSFKRMRDALEARNWNFLSNCAVSHIFISNDSPITYVYAGIAAARLGYDADLYLWVNYGWRVSPGAPEFAREAATVSAALGQAQFSLAFFAIHLLLSEEKAGGEHESVEFILSFLKFLRSAGIEPPYKSREMRSLLPYYFTLMIREIADRISTPTDSLDQHF